MLPSQVFTKLLYSLLLHTEGCAVRRGRGVGENWESSRPDPWTPNCGSNNKFAPPRFALSGALQRNEGIFSAHCQAIDDRGTAQQKEIVVAYNSQLASEEDVAVSSYMYEQPLASPHPQLLREREESRNLSPLSVKYCASPQSLWAARANLFMLNLSRR